MKNYRHSIRMSLGVLYCVMAAIIIVAFFIYNYYASNVIKTQVTEANHGTIELYGKQLDADFSNVESFLSVCLSDTGTMDLLKKGGSDNNVLLAKAGIANELTHALVTYRAVDGFFLYSLADDNYISRLGNPNRTLQQEIKSYSNGICLDRETMIPNRWFAKKIQGQYYLFRIYRQGTLLLGAWIRADSLLAPLDALSRENDGMFFFTDAGGAPLVSDSSAVQSMQPKYPLAFNGYHLTDDREYLVLSAPIERGNFNLTALLREKTLMQGLYKQQIVPIAIMLVLVVFIVLIIVVLQYMILTPIKRICRTMEAAAKGNFQPGAEPPKMQNEFDLILSTFSAMTGELMKLKIDIYEEKLNSQKTMLQYYQLQIRPHFLVNSLNMIYNLAQVREYELVQKLTSYLAEFFRYNVSKNLQAVRLCEELEHVRDYLKIQLIRFPDNLDVHYDVDDGLLQMPIPPLLILTFVENSIKYAIDMEQCVTILVEAQPCGEDPSLAEITVSDTGRGYPGEMLAVLNAGGTLDQKGEKTVGIYNLQQRLRYIYGGRASIVFSNRDTGGAMTRIVLPMHTDDEG
jgi:two-component system sensor histidine kinase YesM